MGVHVDEVRLRADGEYVNRPLNRCARLMAAGHGGQVLLSGTAAAVARGSLPAGAVLRDLGAHRLRDIAEPVQVYQLVHPDLRDEFPPLRTVDTVTGNLPHQVTTFVGRERELRSIGALVRERPLVTLTGVGGVGKTRLAIEVATEVAPHLPDGAWVCPLAPLTDPGAVWDAVAGNLGVQRMVGRDVETVVLEYLTAKQLLLVLDNCEHLLDAVARVVTVIMQRCPGVVVLATSREGLAIPGEHIIAVPSLPVGADGDAVTLFCDRARDARDDFRLTERDLVSVVELCRRLDGIPLAIELAAARLRSLTPEELVARLAQRFHLLTRGSRAALERQQTLRHAIDWSYDLLASTERTALNRLAVFASGCTLATAEVVLPGGEVERGDVVDLLDQLVNKSLVVADIDAGGETRYRLLETIRQYAQERLEASGETAAVPRAAGTPTASSRSPRRSVHTSQHETCWSGSRLRCASSPTCGLRSTGQSRLGRRTMRSDS
jgi:predicted ATPase